MLHKSAHSRLEVTSTPLGWGGDVAIRPQFFLDCRSRDSQEAAESTLVSADSRHIVFDYWASSDDP